MDNVVLDRNSNKVVGYNNKPTTLQYVVDIPDVSNIEKNIVIKQIKQKTNFLGQKIYTITKDNKNIEVSENEATEQKRTPMMEAIEIINSQQLIKNPSEFDIFDIIKEKEKQLLKLYQGYNKCFVFENNLTNYIEVFNNNVHTGFKTLIMEPNSSVELKLLLFDYPVSEVLVSTEPNDCEIVINNLITIENKRTAIEPSKNIVIEMKNTSNSQVIINSFYILVMEGERDGIL